MINEIVSVLDRKDFSSFGSTCRLFKRVLDNDVYFKLPAPAISYASEKIPKISLIHANDAMRQTIQLSNGHLMTRTYPEYKKADISVWQIANGKLLSNYVTSEHVSDFVKIEKNIIAISYDDNSRIDLVDFNNINKPIKLAEVPLPKNTVVSYSVLSSPGCLAFVSDEWQTSITLNVMHFDPKCISSKNISIENIATDISRCRELISLKNDRLIMVSDKKLYFYDLKKIKNQNALIKTIPLPSDAFVLKIKNEKILTASLDCKGLSLNIWDPVQKAGNELLKTISIPAPSYNNLFYSVFQKVNGELLIIISDHILVMNYSN